MPATRAFVVVTGCSSCTQHVAAGRLHCRLLQNCRTMSAGISPPPVCPWLYLVCQLLAVDQYAQLAQHHWHPVALGALGAVMMPAGSEAVTLQGTVACKAGWVLSKLWRLAWG